MTSARSLLVITFLAASALTAAAQDVAAVPKPADTIPRYTATG